MHLKTFINIERWFVNASVRTIFGKMDQFQSVLSCSKPEYILRFWVVCLNPHETFSFKDTFLK